MYNPMYRALVNRGNGSSFELFSEDKQGLIEVVSMVKSAIREFYGQVDIFSPTGRYIAVIHVDGRYQELENKDKYR